MNNTIGFFKSTGIYFLGNVFSKLIMFFLLPAYTHFLTTEQLGYYDVANTYLNLVVTFLFLDIYVGIMRFIFDEKDKKDYFRPVTNGLVIFFSSFLLYSLIALVLYCTFDIPYLGYIYLYGVCLVFNNLIGYVARAFKLNSLFAVSGVAGTFITCSICLVGLVYLQWGLVSLYYGAIAGLVTQIVILERKVKLFHQVSRKYIDKPLLGRLFKYALPLSVNSLSYWLLTGYSNAMITRMLGVDQNGVFVVAVKFGLVINLVSTCFNMVWQEMIFQRGNEDKEDLGRFYSKAVNLLILFLGITSMLLIHFSHLIFPFMVGEAFSASFQLIPIYLIATILNVISAFFGQIYAALKITNIIMYSTFTACLVNVVGVPLFIQAWGLTGAVIAIVISYLVNVIMRIIILRKRVLISLDKKQLFILTLSLLASLGVYWMLDNYFNLLCMIGILAISIIIYRSPIHNFLSSLLRKSP